MDIKVFKTTTREILPLKNLFLKENNRQISYIIHHLL
jgi:hypothetical protein